MELQAQEVSSFNEKTVFVTILYNKPYPLSTLNECVSFACIYCWYSIEHWYPRENHTKKPLTDLIIGKYYPTLNSPSSFWSFQKWISSDFMNECVSSLHWRASSLFVYLCPCTPPANTRWDTSPLPVPV